MTALAVSAFAKVNLCLLLGGIRDDRRHELVTLFESVGLADRLRLVVPSPSGRDEVVCPGVRGPNLAADAIASLRAVGWGALHVRVEIDKRIPVAAGMGGGSADAAAVLRSAPAIAPVDPDDVREIAARLGSDVPSQIDPGPSLGRGAGDIVERVPELAEHALLVVPQQFGLSTAEVYAEADRLGLGRGGGELTSLCAQLQAAVTMGGARLPEALLVNDLEPAALSLRPELGAALNAATDAGSERSLVCGSGPTVIGVFWGQGAFARAQDARAAVADRFPGAVAVAPVRRGVGAPTTNP